MPSAPLYYRWQGDGFTPLARHAKLADQQFVIGEIYRLEIHEERSGQTHRHQFAWLRDAWLNLPERLAGHPMTLSPEHLRKWALIETGWCDTQTFYCSSHAEAVRWAQNLRPLDEYTKVSVAGSTVVRQIAKSQSVRAMGKRDFQESKTAILDYIAGLLEVEPSELEKTEAA